MVILQKFRYTQGRVVSENEVNYIFTKQTKKMEEKELCQLKN